MTLIRRNRNISSLISLAGWSGLLLSWAVCWLWLYVRLTDWLFSSVVIVSSMGPRPPAGSLEAAVHDALGTPAGAASAALGVILLSFLIAQWGLRGQRKGFDSAYVVRLVALNLVYILGVAGLAPLAVEVAPEQLGLPGSWAFSAYRYYYWGLLATLALTAAWYLAQLAMAWAERRSR